MAGKKIAWKKAREKKGQAQKTPREKMAEDEKGRGKNRRR